MTSSRNHQEAHGIGQIEEQLKQQADAAKAIQGENESDREIAEILRRDTQSSLDEIIDK
ncbi:hypothetical protein ACFOLF_02885 [Paenibacillus sepulcri]|uniref:Uncharacterized protein n=1 Tax=Paenibacillus sepulcri TaxID=359917 RepID=A0ABS7C4U9_9BACL|nr:hypothetical protein [Paenibacillus sepulcri]